MESDQKKRESTENKEIVMQSLLLKERPSLSSERRTEAQFNNSDEIGVGNIDMDTMLAMALEERNMMVSQSSVWQELQNDINMALSGSKGLNLRLEGIAAATKSFNMRRKSPSRLSEALSNFKHL